MQKQSLSNKSIESFFASRPKDCVQTIDYGNSHPHFATFKNGKLEEVKPVDNEDLDTSKAMISSVSQQKETSTDILWKDNAFCDMPVHYKQLELGKDRLFQAAFIYHLYRGEEVVLIDAGTFLTIDFIDKKGFNGGFIFQGIKTFLASYTAGTRLPNLSKDDINLKMPTKLPSSTNEAIKSASTYYIRGVLSSLSDLLGNKKVILTGGESHLIKTLLTNSIIIPHLIHYSLYFLKQEIRKKEQERLS